MKLKFWYKILSVSLIGISCAQFVPPTGGDKDIISPKLVKSFPENKTLNFKGKTLQLEFDEIIDVSSLRQDLLIIPEHTGSYTLKQTSRGVRLVFDQPFKDSTTYTFNFRNGIKDINERNPAQNLKLVFSTGNKIDSLSIKGKAEDLWSKEPLFDITVGIYNITDTVPYLKRKPDYFTKTDSSGNFLLENIKNNDYRLIAFKDKNLNLLYDQKTDLLGFLPDTLHLDNNKETPVIKLYKADHTINKVKRVISRENTFTIQMEKSSAHVSVKYQNSNDSLTYFFKANEITFFNNPIASDTIKANIMVTDSLQVNEEFEQKIYFNKSQGTNTSRRKTLLPLPVNIEPKSGSGVIVPFEYYLKFETPISKIDSQKISILRDTIPVPITQISWTDINHTHLHIKALSNTPRGDNSLLKIGSAAFTNFRGDTSAVISIKNKILTKEDVGIIEGSTKIKEKDVNKIAQLVNTTTGEVISEMKFTDNFRFDNVIPETYSIRIIIDENNNGIWDPGDFIHNKMPEKVLISKDVLKLKANFEIKDIVIEE